VTSNFFIERHPKEIFRDHNLGGSEYFNVRVTFNKKTQTTISAVQIIFCFN